MGFATSWLEKRALFPEIFKETPDNQTGIIVVVPAFNEPGIPKLLNSLVSCDEPECKVEVIIIVNAGLDASKESLLNNQKSLQDIESWKKSNNNYFFRLFVFDAGQPSLDGWGAGMARKTGMDEALRRFNSIHMPDGVIVSLDADCTVEENYFTSICNDLLIMKKRSACSIYFEHPLSGNDFPAMIYEYITSYELHLRYYIQGLRYSGFPYPFHTVGSAIAVKAKSYLKAGGMNRRQAGEDFYFIQKIVPMGGFFTLNSTTVYPSPRESFRVPFGTGPAVARFMENNDQDLLTYNIESFRELHSFFCMINKLYESNFSELNEYYRLLPEGLKSFINDEEWLSVTTGIKHNTASQDSFRKRFFGWFNMFKVVKYMNHVHSSLFEKQAVPDSAYALLTESGHRFLSKNPYDLLIFYRDLEKSVVVEE